MKKHAKVIDVIKRINHGIVPVFVTMIHRHLEKEKPGPTSTQGRMHHYEVPVDLLMLSVPKELSHDVESVEFVYQAAGADIPRRA